MEYTTEIPLHQPCPNNKTGQHRLLPLNTEELYCTYCGAGLNATHPGPQGPPGRNGTNGRDGKDGADGKNGYGRDGKDGADGKDGVDGQSVTGPEGPRGPQGERGIPGTTVDTQAHDSLISAIPRTLNYLKHEDKLTKFRAAQEAGGPINIFVVGDSISEGTGNSIMDNRWITKLQDKLNYRHGKGSGAKYPFIPGQYKTPVAHPHAATNEFVTINSTTGLGWRTVILSATGEAVYQFHGTSFKLAFFSAATGIMTVNIDGNAIDVDTNKTRNPTYSGQSSIWASGPLPLGDHVIKVTRKSGTTEHPYLQGIYTYNQDEADGYRLIDGSYHGMSSNFLTAERSSNQAGAIMAINGDKPSLVMLNIGTNDYAANTTVSVYKENILRFLTELKTKGYNGSIVLLNCYKSSNVDENRWRGYYKALYEIAASNPDISVMDWRGRIPDSIKPTTTSLYPDGIHPSDLGSEGIATIMVDYLSMRS